jgi:hypothetical protein
MRSPLFTLPLLLLTACGGGSNDEGENPGDCSDNIDNDSDGQTDCFDAGCSQTVACLEDAFTGEKGDKGDQGNQGEPGPQGEQGEPGQDGEDGLDGLANRTVLTISHDANGQACVDNNYQADSTCCPTGFSLVGTFYEGYSAALCVEDTPTSKSSFYLWANSTGARCENFSNPGDCCPNDYSHIGYLGHPERPLCLEN